MKRRSPLTEEQLPPPCMSRWSSTSDNSETFSIRPFFDSHRINEQTWHQTGPWVFDCVGCPPDNSHG